MKKYIKEIAINLSWVIISILLAVLYRYGLIINKGNYGWAESFYVWIGGFYVGLIAAVLLIILNYIYIQKKIKNIIGAYIVKILLVISFIITTVYIHENYM